jgi:hypothetical protein
MSAKQALNPIPSDLLPRLDPCFVEYYNKNTANNPATHQIPLEEVRANPRRWARSWAVDTKDSGDTRIRDSTVAASSGGDINDFFKVRTYHPDEAIWGSGPYAAHVNFHGKRESRWAGKELKKKSHTQLQTQGAGGCLGT